MDRLAGVDGQGRRPTDCGQNSMDQGGESTGAEVSEPGLKAKYDKACQDYPGESLSVAYFKVDRVLPLAGGEEGD